MFVKSLVQKHDFFVCLQVCLFVCFEGFVFAHFFSMFVSSPKDQEQSSPGQTDLKEPSIKVEPVSFVNGDVRRWMDVPGTKLPVKYWWP